MLDPHYIIFAREIAQQAHSYQKDKAGKPYIEHVYAVVEGVSDDEATVVAYLHDIVEDTYWTLTELQLYFPPNIVDAIDCLTRRNEESYKNFVQRIKQNKLATEVKISDLKHNMQIDRITNPTEQDYKRIEKYRKALEALTT